MAITKDKERIIAGNFKKIIWKMKSVILVGIVLISCNNNAENSAISHNSASDSLEKKQVGIQFFKGSWDDALKKAKEKNKFIFVDCYADWCVPCKWMEKHVFPQSDVGNYFNEHFINYTMNTDDKGLGTAFYKKYGLTGYPSFCFFTPSGDIAHISQGSRDGSQFIAVGNQALDTGFSLFALKRKYDNGDRNEQTLYNYLFAIKDAFLFMDKYKGIMNEYLKQQSQEKLLSPGNWKYIKNFVTEVKDPLFKTLLSQQDLYTAKYGKQAVDSLIYNIKLTDFANNKNWKGYASSVTEYINLMPDANPDNINDIVWTMIDNISDTKLLTSVAQWQQKSIEKQENYSYLDTYANLLYKLGRIDEAKQVINKAIEVAKKNGDSTESVEELLTKINS